MPEVYSDQLRDRGLITEIYGNFSGGTVDIRSNSISQMKSFIFSADYSKSPNDYNTSENITVSHCDYIYSAHDQMLYSE